jgi:hypothetical protein
MEDLEKRRGVARWRLKVERRADQLGLIWFNLGLMELNCLSPHPFIDLLLVAAQYDLLQFTWDSQPPLGCTSPSACFGYHRAVTLHQSHEKSGTSPGATASNQHLSSIYIAISLQARHSSRTVQESASAQLPRLRQ